MAHQQRLQTRPLLARRLVRHPGERQVRRERPALPLEAERFQRLLNLAREMRAPENQPMRRSTVRDVSDADIDRIAATMMALPRTL